MEAVTQPPTRPSDAREKIPPLQNGDRLTRAEFERRYAAMPHLKKAELIEGVVYRPSPVRHIEHGRPHFHLNGWLLHYAAYTPGVDGGDNSSLRLDLKNEPQPDAFLRLLPSYGGESDVDEDGYVVGAPELIAEVAASSVSYDLGDKREAYRRNGVRAYVVWRVQDHEIDWFILRGDDYEALTADAAGVFRSEVLPGLWLNAPALLGSDLAAMLRTLQEGLASPDHAAYLSRLEATATEGGD
jgi:Uma2 family endonuclease